MIETKMYCDLCKRRVSQLNRLIGWKQAVLIHLIAWMGYSDFFICKDCEREIEKNWIETVNKLKHGGAVRNDKANRS